MGVQVYRCERRWYLVKGATVGHTGVQASGLLAILPVRWVNNWDSGLHSAPSLAMVWCDGRSVFSAVLTSVCLSGAQQPGLSYYTDPGGPGLNAGNPTAMAFQVQPNSPLGSAAYPPPPSYCNTPPPPYEQVVKAK